MKNLFLAIAKELAAGHPCYLLTLAESEGSTPRGIGAHMAVGADGLLGGTIGGGVMEYAAITRARKLLLQKNAPSLVEHYDLTPGAGLACGGSCTVLFTPICSADADVINRVLAYEQKREEYWLQVAWGSPFHRPNGGYLSLKKAAESLLSPQKRQGNIHIDGAKYYVEQFNYDGSVYVFGAGHVARELVPLLSHLGFT